MDLATQIDGNSKKYTQLLDEKTKKVYSFASDLEEKLKDIFSKHPEILLISWTQGTPSWNDGDACEFGVYEPCFATNDTQLQDNSCEAEDISYKGLDYTLYEPGYKSEVLGGLSSLVYGNKELVEYCFGDGARVIIDPELNIEIKEGYCGYY